MAFWLFKTEPDVFGIDDLKARGARGECWDGVRNYQARNFLRDQVARSDQVMIYHSSCDRVGVAGLAEVIRAGYPDPSQFDPGSPYHDDAARSDAPRWYSVDLRFRKAFPRIITLAELKTLPQLDGWQLLRKGNRLSILPVTPQQWRTVLDQLETP